MLEAIKALIATRGTQLFSRWIGKGLLVLGGHLAIVQEQANVTMTADTLAALGAAAICFMIDWYSHRAQAQAKQ